MERLGIFDLVNDEDTQALIELSVAHKALYICPKINGKRLGPLVVYAGKDKQGRNLVGDIYFNFSKIEESPRATRVFAEVIYQKLGCGGLVNRFDTVCGVPNGGRTLGQALAEVAEKRFVYLEKSPKPTKAGHKQEFTWELSRFELEAGERVVVLEDVFNNFQNTDSTLTAIASSGVEIIALCGALNRSLYHQTSYRSKIADFPDEIPVLAAIAQSFAEFEQDDSEVAEDITNGNVVYEVKKNWPFLQAVMLEHSAK